MNAPSRRRQSGRRRDLVVVTEGLSDIEYTAKRIELDGGRLLLAVDRPLDGLIQFACPECAQFRFAIIEDTEFPGELILREWHEARCPIWDYMDPS